MGVGVSGVRGGVLNGQNLSVKRLSVKKVICQQSLIDFAFTRYQTYAKHYDAYY